MRIIATVTHNRLPELARKLPKEAERVVGVTLKAGHDNIVRGMQASSPPVSSPGAMPAIDTGALVGSLETEQSGASGALGIGGGDAYYAIFLEHGTSRMAARPFMHPTASMMQGVLDREMTAALRRLGG